MIQVRRANRQDLPAIEALLKLNGKFDVLPELINARDVSLVAREPEGACIGHLWMGLMACNRIGYLDRFVVHPDFARQGVGNKLALRMLEIAKGLGVVNVFGCIRHDEWHDKSSVNALKCAFSAHSDPYTFVTASIDKILSELKGK